MLEQVCNS